MNKPARARFELRDILGQGGMGVVYDAYDHEREMRVALKRLRNVDAASVFHFKREFRALRDLSHPNIIELYELVAEGDDWYLTMERVDGTSIIKYVRAGRSPTPLVGGVLESNGADTHTVETRTVGQGQLFALEGVVQAPYFGLPRAPSEPRHIDDIVDLGRLRDCLRQLAHALYALHSAGMVHRDLKPSNVFVTAEGRVVLMDFGVVAERALNDATEARRLVGTPAYMAPEQVRGGEARPRADWYAFGVLMYLALTGHLPHVGPVHQMLRAKVQVPPLSISTFAHAVPADLQDLCVRLMAIDPDDRPGDQEILDVLGVRDEHAPFSGDSTFHSSNIFVGRAEQLALLEQAYRDVAGGATCCVVVTGPSGMGKTSLLTHFIESRNEDRLQRPTVLEGRCQEQENLSYKAFDGVIDALSSHLLALEPGERDALEPPGVHALARIFPVLQRIPDWFGETALDDLAPQELRVQAVDALRALLKRMAEVRPVIVRIDDIHWADRDSVGLLLGVLEAPLPGRVLVVCAMSSDVHDDSSHDEISRMLEVLEERGVARRIELGPLGQTEERALINALAMQRGFAPEFNDFLWHDAGGHPMLLAELVWYTMEAPDQASTAAGLGLEGVMKRRLANLPEAARTLLEVMAIAGQPLPLFVLAEAGRVPSVERERSVSILRLTHLTRTVRKHGNQRWLDVYHDKVRETVLTYMSGSRSRTIHRRLARALESWPGAKSSALARHWLASGDPRRAAGYLVAAAQQAVSSLALDRAGQLFRAASALMEDLSAPGMPDPQLEIMRARSWIGLVQTAGTSTDVEHSLALLEQARPLALEHDLVVELANIHVLRGHIRFSQGDVERGLKEYGTSYIHAQQSGKSSCEAQALAGMGHAYFMRGDLAAAREHYDRCIAAAREDELRGIEISTLPARAISRYYHFDIDGALDDVRSALEAARCLQVRRVELFARSALGFILLENGKLDEARSQLDDALDLVHRSSVAANVAGLELALVALIARHDDASGRRAEGVLAIARALAQNSETSVRFAGPVALGALALATEDAPTRQRALARGEALVRDGSAGHGHLFFYRDAIDACYRAGDADTMERYAGLLARETRVDDLPWSRLIVARGQALAHHLRGARDAEDRGRIERLCEETSNAGLRLAGRALERALSDF